MKFIPNLDYQNVDQCLDYLKNNKLNYYGEQHLLFHVFWNGKLSRRQLLCIKSFLYSQNLSNSSLYIWLDSDYDYNRKVIPKHPNISIKIYNPEIESQHTPFEGQEFINFKKNMKFRSDLARMIILYNYGGIYFDLDLILFKDLRCISDLDFCYQWGGVDGGNNALLGLKKGSKTTIQIMKKYIKFLSEGCNHTSEKYNSNYQFKLGFTHELLSSEIDLFCFPSAFFDPIWILDFKNKKSKYDNLNRFDDFFKTTDKKVTINKMFQGLLLGYHWHSRNDIQIEKNSYYQQIEYEIIKFTDIKNKYISFSLWVESKPLSGDGKIDDNADTYILGTIENLKLQQYYFKDWKIRVYLDSSVPMEYQEQIKSFGGEIIDMSNSKIPGMYWRFLIIEDPKVDVFIVRDTDSRISYHDENAVNQWLKTNKKLHICRDHPHHYYKMLGGMWGFKNYLDRDVKISNLINCNQKFKKMDDIYFLEKQIYPNYAISSVIHDQYYKVEAHSQKFDNFEIGEYYNFIGEMFNHNNERQYLKRDQDIINNQNYKKTMSNSKWSKYFR
jgi:hypothetical protein